MLFVGRGVRELSDFPHHGTLILFVAHSCDISFTMIQGPSGCRNLKVQAWGAGGGSGNFSGGQCGDGGGGSFAEAILCVTPEEELEV